MGRRLLFLGPPGAGKGTQAAQVAAAIGIPHISTGEMLRAAVAAGTDLGKQAEAIMAAGELVPDELVTALVVERLGADDAVCGYLLDGFPRNAAQAATLADALGPGGIEVAVLLEVPEDELVARLLNRAAEQGRTDDNEVTIRRRLAVYREQTEPLVQFYSDRLARVDGLGSVDAVLARVVSALVP